MRIELPATVAVFALLLTAAVAPAAAAPITYSESVSGDLGASLPASSIFALDAGVNTVSGTLAFTNTGGLEQDSFALSVPIGMQLTAISFAFATTLAGVTTAAEKFFLLDNDNIVSFPFLAFQTIDVLGASPFDAFTSALPLGPGIYGMLDNGGHIDGAGFTTDYTWSLTVEPVTAVPEPVSLVLLGAGLCGALVRRYRHQR